MELYSSPRRKVLIFKGDRFRQKANGLLLRVLRKVARRPRRLARESGKTVFSSAGGQRYISKRITRCTRVLCAHKCTRVIFECESNAAFRRLYVYYDKFGRVAKL